MVSTRITGLNMQRIERLKSKSELETATVYTYIVSDELGNKQDITSLQAFKEGDRVETWWKEKYNRPGMRLYKQSRATD